MSREIDERVVQMRFENGQFERNVQTSIHSLNELKRGLDFKDAGRGFSQLENASKNVKLDPLTIAVEQLNSKFSLLGITAFNVMNRISNAAIDTGEKLIKSLTIDQVTPGWEKYGQKTTAVQTIMAATAKQFSDTGQQMEIVNSQLEKLNWFTDETSYNFVDMVSNIGKFTSNNIALDQSVTAMQGIANWAAISGANANEASRAMYNLSQALATGTVKLIDWKSIENANMATTEFKQTVIDIAEEQGTLLKVSEDTWTTLDKKIQVTSSNFNEGLQKGWFTNDVLMKALDRYGAATNRLNEIYEELDHNVTTSDIVSTIDDYTAALSKARSESEELGLSSEETAKRASEAGRSIAEEVADDWGISIERATEILAEFDNETMQFGLKAFKAAQEAKTFEDAINSVKDAVSTGWMKSFEIIFGDYMQAKEFWTNIANSLYDIFADSASARNDMLKAWSELGGRNYFIDSVYGSLAAILSILNPIKQAFNDVFGTLTAEGLYDLTVKLHGFIKQLILVGKPAEDLRRIFRGLFSILDSIGYVVTSLAKGAFTILSEIMNALNIDVLGFFANLSDGIYILNYFIKKTNIIQIAFSGIASAILQVISRIREFLNAVAQFGPIQNVIKTLQEVFGENFNIIQVILSLAAAAVMSFYNLITSIPPITSLSSLGGVFGTLGAFVVKCFKDAGSAFEGFLTLVKEGWKKLKGFLSDAGDTFSGTATTAGRALSFLADQMEKIDWAGVTLVAMGVMVMATAWKFADAMTIIAKSISQVTNIGGSIQKAFNSISAYFDELKAEQTSNRIIKIAVAIGILAISLGAIAKLAKEDWPALIAAAVAIGILGGALTGVMIAINKFGSGNGLPGASQLLAFAASVAAIALALNMIKIDDSLATRMLVLTVIIGAFAGLCTVMSKTAMMVRVGITSMIAMALGINLLVSTLNRLAKLDPGEILAAMPLLVAIMTILAVFTRFANRGIVFNREVGKFKPVLTITSMIAMIIALQGLISVIKRLGSMNPETAVNGIMRIIPIFTMLNILFLIVNQTSGEVAKFGTMLMGIAVAMNLMIPAIKGMAALSGEQIARAAIPIVALTAIFGQLMGAAGRRNGAHADKLAIMILSLTGALMILQLVIKALGRMDLVSLAKGITAVSLILLSFAPLVKVAIGPSDANAVKVMTKMIVAISILLAAVAVLSFFDPVRLAATCGSIGVLLLSMGGAFKLLDGIEVPRLSGMAKIITAVTLLGLVISGLSWLTNWQGALAIAGGLSMVLIALGVAFKFADGVEVPSAESAKAIRDFIITLGLVMGGLALLSKMVKPVEFLALTTGMSEVILSLGVCGKLIGDTSLPSEGSMDALTKMVTAVGGIVLILGIVQGIINQVGGSTDGVLVLTTGMSEILLALGASARIMGDQSSLPTPDVKTLLAFGAMVAGIGAAVGFFSQWVVSPAAAIALATGMSEVIIALGFSLRILGNLEQSVSPMMLALVGIMAVITAAMGGILAYLSTVVNPEAVLPIAVGMSAVVLALSASVLILGHFPAGAFITALEALGILAIIVAAMGGLTYLLGRWATDPAFTKALADGGQCMILLGEAIGGFIGGIIGGFAEGAMTAIAHALPEFGQALSDFMANAQPFFDGLGGVSGALGAIGELIAVLVAFTAAEFVGAISQLPGVKQVLDTIFGAGDTAFADTFQKLGEMLKSFADSVGDVDVDRVHTAAEAAHLLVDLEESLPRKGGVLEQFLGRKDIGTFGSNLQIFGSALAGFVTETGSITSADVEGAVSAAKMLSDIERNIPAQGGKLQTWVGSQDIGKFGDRLSSFGYGLYIFKGWVSGIKASDVEGAYSAGMMLAKLEDNLPYTGGKVTSWFFGEKSLSSFGERLKEFGSALATFSWTVTGTLNSAAMNTAIEIAGKLAELEKTLDKTGGAGSIFYGDSSFKNFGNNLSDLGWGMRDLSSRLDEVNFSNLRTALDYIKELASLTKLNSASKLVTTAARRLLQDVIDIVADNEAALRQKGQDIAKWIALGFDKGVKDHTLTVARSAKVLANTITKTVEDELEIASPSAVMIREGYWVVRGLAEGIDEDTSAEEAARKKAQNIVSAFENGLQGIANLSENRNLKFDIWKLTDGKNATSEETVKMELDNRMEDLKEAAQKANVYQLALQEVEKQVGKGTAEYIAAENKHLEALKNVYTIKAEIDETVASMSPYGSTQKDKAEEYVAIIEEYKEAYEFLGKTQEELYQFAREQSGYGMEEAPREEKTYDTQALLDSILGQTGIVEYAADEVEKKTKSSVKSGTSAGASAGLIEGFENAFNSPETKGGILDSIKNLFDWDLKGELENQLDVWTGGGDGLQSAAQLIGNFFGLGFAEGTELSMDNVSEAVQNMGNKALTLLQRVLNEHSPSKETHEIGEYFDKGFALGVDDGTNDVIASVNKLGETALKTLNTKLNSAKSNSQTSYSIGAAFASGILTGVKSSGGGGGGGGTSDKNAGFVLNHAIKSAADAIGLDDDHTLTITPVLDLDEVKNRVSELYSTINKGSSISVSASKTQASSIASQKNSTSQNGSSKQASETTYSFTQNNYSPKALNRTDIYRQTSNQFSQLKNTTSVTKESAASWLNIK